MTKLQFEMSSCKGKNLVTLTFFLTFKLGWNTEGPRLLHTILLPFQTPLAKLKNAGMSSYKLDYGTELPSWEIQKHVYTGVIYLPSLM